MITYIPPFSGSFSPGHQRPQRRCRPPSQTCPARCSSSWRPGQVLHGAWGGLGFRVGHYDSNNKNTNSNNNNSNNNSNNDNTNYDDHKDIIIHTHTHIYIYIYIYIYMGLKNQTCPDFFFTNTFDDPCLP